MLDNLLNLFMILRLSLIEFYKSISNGGQIMRYLILAVIPFVMFILISCAFAQSPETETLKSKVEMLEKELQEIKTLLRQQSEKDVQKEKEMALLKEEVQKKDVKITAEESHASVKEPVVKEATGEESYLARKSAELSEKKLA